MRRKVKAGQLRIIATTCGQLLSCQKKKFKWPSRKNIVGTNEGRIMEYIYGLWNMELEELMFWKYSKQYLN